MFGMNLLKSDISQSIRTAVFDYLQKNKNIDSLDTIVSTVEQIQSNYNSTQRVTSNNVRRTREDSGYPPHEWTPRDCHLCGGRHYYKKDCKYSCKYSSSPNTSPEDKYHRSHSNPPRNDRRDTDIRGNPSASCNRVRREQITSPGRRSLFGDHASLFDSVRISPQQTN